MTWPQDPTIGTICNTLVAVAEDIAHLDTDSLELQAATLKRAITLTGETTIVLQELLRLVENQIQGIQMEQDWPDPPIGEMVEGVDYDEVFADAREDYQRWAKLTKGVDIPF